MKKLLCTFIFAGLAAATPVSITLSDAIQTGVQGQTLEFDGSLANGSTGLPSDVVYINSDNLIVDSPLSGDDFMFLSNAPATLATPDKTSIFDMFEITIPSGIAPGVYHGEIQVLGGGAFDLNNLADASFCVKVPGVAPEPQPMMLIAPAMLLFGAGLWRRKRFSPAKL